MASSLITDPKNWKHLGDPAPSSPSDPSGVRCAPSAEAADQALQAPIVPTHKLSRPSNQRELLLNEDLRLAGGFTRELLPCPFCGSVRPITAGFVNTDTNIVVYQCLCHDCGASISANKGGGEGQAVYARNAAIEKWNARA